MRDLNSDIRKGPLGSQNTVNLTCDVPMTANETSADLTVGNQFKFLAAAMAFEMA